jgi:hypothetical protein
VETQTRCIQEFDCAFAWIHVHHLVEFGPLGVPVKGSGNVVPGAAGHLPANGEAVNGLSYSGLVQAAPMPCSGNLHPIGLLERGTREQIAAQVCCLVHAEAGKPFIRGAADCVTRDAPEGSLRAALVGPRSA